MIKLKVFQKRLTKRAQQVFWPYHIEGNGGEEQLTRVSVLSWLAKLRVAKKASTRSRLAPESGTIVTRMGWNV